MSFLKRIFGKKEETIKSNQEFWNWFQKKEQTFFKVVKEHTHVQRDFLDNLSPKLGELREGFFYLTGMADDQTAELILTPDGEIKNIVFVEELVAAAPEIKGWLFTALKPASDIENVGIRMGGYTFSKDNLFFYSNEDSDYPDEIDITIVHLEMNVDNQKQIRNGTYIFLDNYLGELDFVNNIDSVKIIGKCEAKKELVPIKKLKDFLIWRQKEFIEKYEGTRYDIENDNYSLFEGEVEEGRPLLALLNTDLLRWDKKASHPWIVTFEINYDGENYNGMPGQETSVFLNNIEEEIMEYLKTSEGYLNIGRQTANNLRSIYFACKDFRKPSKILDEIQNKYADQVEMDFEIYKDKYWQSFNRFNQR